MQKFGNVLKCAAAIAVMGASALSAAAQGAYRLTPQIEGSNGLIIKDLGNGEWEFETTGSHPVDPFFVAKTDKPVPFGTHYMLSFDGFAGQDMGKVLVFVGAKHDNAHLVEYPNLPRSEGWMNTAIDLSQAVEKPDEPFNQVRITLGAANHPGKKVRIRNLCLREPSTVERKAAEGRFDKIAQDRALSKRLDEYLDKKFDAKIRSVSYKDGKIRVRGSLPRGMKDYENIYLAEIPMWTDVTNLTKDSDIYLEPLDSGTFRKSFSRIVENKRDRLISGWAVVEEKDGRYELLSAMHYLDDDDIEPRADMPMADPRSLKGIGGCPMDHEDMEILQIATATFNLLPHTFVFTSDAPNREPYEYAGRTFYIDMNNIKGLDNDMLHAAAKNMMVSAIVLIPKGHHEPDGSWLKMVAHPDAYESAAFALPYLENEDSILAYAAAISFITERYSRPDGKYGRIHNYVIHNEINAAFFWTSAGDKTLLTYLDIYQKSMRMTQIYARLYDSHAKTLISLDHDWLRTDGDPRVYQGKHLMENLVRFSRQEGDFEWGIAFHPYAQNIFNPRVWEDPDAQLSFDTPYLTFKNLEVIDTWAKMPEHAYKKKVMREIQLTEQGVNTRNYEKESLDENAVGVGYTWKRIEPLTSITTYAYHLWGDAPEEGGLLLGLRKLPEWAYKEDPRGKKPAWFLFKDYDTPEWPKWNKFCLDYLGLQSWDDIYSDFAKQHKQVSEGGRFRYKKLSELEKERAKDN